MSSPGSPPRLATAANSVPASAASPDPPLVPRGFSAVAMMHPGFLVPALLAYPPAWIFTMVLIVELWLENSGSFDSQLLALLIVILLPYGFVLLLGVLFARFGHAGRRRRYALKAAELRTMLRTLFASGSLDEASFEDARPRLDDHAEGRSRGEVAMTTGTALVVFGSLALAGSLFACFVGIVAMGEVSGNDAGAFVGVLVAGLIGLMASIAALVFGVRFRRAGRHAVRTELDDIAALEMTILRSARGSEGGMAVRAPTMSAYSVR